MRCPICHRGNPPGANFCIGCGAPLSAAVPLEANSGSSGPRASVEYVGFWVRLAATLLDLLFVSTFLDALFILFGIVAMYTFGDPEWAEGLGFIGGLVLAVVFLPLFFLYAWLFTGLRGQTPGKRLLHIKVVNGQGKTPGLARALLRETVGKLVSSAFGLGFMWIAFDVRKQAFHDLMSHTYVVMHRSDVPVRTMEQAPDAIEHAGWTTICKRTRLWEGCPQPGGLKSFLSVGGSDSGLVEHKGSALRFTGKKVRVDVPVIESVSQVRADLRLSHFLLYFVVLAIVLSLPLLSSTRLLIAIALASLGTLMSWWYLRQYGGWVRIAYTSSDGQAKDIGLWAAPVSGGSRRLYGDLSKLVAPSLHDN